jgi:hypothetical protein
VVGGRVYKKKAEICWLPPKIIRVVVANEGGDDESEKREREIRATGSCRNGLFGMNERGIKFFP